MYSGSASIASQTASGNAYIDGLLQSIRWSSALSYSAPDSASDYQPTYSYDYDGDGLNVINDGFFTLNSAQTIAFQAVLDTARYGGYAPGGEAFAVEGFTNLQISNAGAGSGTGVIRIANSQDPSPNAGYAFILNNTFYSGDVFLNGSSATVTAPAPGTHGWHTMQHEVGHALGLVHGHVPGPMGTLPSDKDGMEYTVMTYRSYIGQTTPSYTVGSTSAPQTFMQLDIQALQYMYGANYTINNGNTTYTWDSTNGSTLIDGDVALSSPGGKIFETIWDGGGVDTYDLSAFTTSVSINLAPGEFSTIASSRLADLGDGNTARGNVANALLFNGDTRSIIENANGGSVGDTLRGNQVENFLRGNGGNDFLFGLGGGDHLEGGNGADLLDGGTGYDWLDGGAGADIYYADETYELIVETVGNGIDWLLASNSFDLAAGVYVEELTLQGTGNNYLHGNEIAQQLTGNSGNNRINGRAGNDTLTGAAGNDTFVFSTALSANIDTITDFSVAVDKIELSRSVFLNLNAGSTLNASAFRAGTTALDSDDRIMYDISTGALYYDRDANGGSYSSVQFATLQGSAALSASNFVLVA